MCTKLPVCLTIFLYGSDQAEYTRLLAGRPAGDACRSPSFKTYKTEPSG